MTINTFLPLMQQLQRFFFIFSMIFCLSLTVVAQNSMQKAIQKAINYPQATNAILGVSVVNTADNNEIFGYQSNYALKPASSQKIVTTAAALGILGKNFTFETKIWATGSIKNGVLEGDIILQGGGDPTLGFMRHTMGKKSHELFREWINQIKAAGITKINGKIIGDPTIFDSQIIPKNWQWEDMGNYFGAGAAGLNFYENKYDIQFLPKGKIGESAQIQSIHPPLEGVEVVNEVRIGDKNSTDQAVIFCAPYSTALVVRGTVPSGSKAFSITGAVQNPALFTAAWFKVELEKAGIEVVKGEDFLLNKKPSIYQNAQLIHTHYSAPLAEIVYWANKKSINIYCEAMVKMIGLKQYNVGSYEKGIEAIQKYWKKLGVNISGWNLCDGSGLSPSNALPPRVHAQILSAIVKEPYYSTLNHSLSKACVADNGSLGGMLCDTKCANNLRAKSGYINQCKAYAGLVENSCGDLLSFSVMINNYQCSNQSARQLLSNIMQAITELE